ncbi:MAG: radical SAM protein [bacterium]|nr:radical SAM protein [bacterium]
MAKILLLNPPGDQLYLRDYYCSHVSKARYYWHPYDLLVQSGFLSQEHQVHALDANLLRLSEQETFKRIQQLDIDTIFFLTGAVSWRADFAFIQTLISQKPMTVIATGDILLHRGIEMMNKYPFLDAILLDFTSDALVKYLHGVHGKPIDYLIYRYHHQIIEGRRITDEKEFSLPLARYELFPWKRYRIPHGLRMPFASTLTNFGCPFKCTFCIGSEIPLKLRKIDNVVTELAYLTQRFGIREAWVKDLTFAANRKHAVEFCNAMIASKLNYGWVCLSRVNVVDEELLQLMKSAGCHTIQFGVESGDERILETYAKGIRKEQVVKIFSFCRKLGIRTLAHFMLGLPGETEQSALKTIEFAKAIQPDFASFNIAVPRMGTKFRQEAIDHGWTSAEIDILDNSVAFPVLETPTMPKETLWKLRNHAIRSFHLRPSYLWHRLVSVRTGYELCTLFREGLSLIGSTLKPAKGIPIEPT